VPCGLAQRQGTERFVFNERVRFCHAVVQTGEHQTWANFLFNKGGIAQALRP
jgi:L-fucose mutarotase